MTTGPRSQKERKKSHLCHHGGIDIPLQECCQQGQGPQQGQALQVEVKHTVTHLEQVITWSDEAQKHTQTHRPQGHCLHIYTQTTGTLPAHIHTDHRDTACTYTHRPQGHCRTYTHSTYTHRPQGHCLHIYTQTTGTLPAHIHTDHRDTACTYTHRPQGHCLHIYTQTTGTLPAHIHTDHRDTACIYTQTTGTLPAYTHRPQGHCLHTYTQTTGTLPAHIHTDHRDTACTHTHRPQGHCLHTYTQTTGTLPAHIHTDHRDTACTYTHRPQGHCLHIHTDHRDTVCTYTQTTGTLPAPRTLRSLDNSLLSVPRFLSGDLWPEVFLCFWPHCLEFLTFTSQKNSVFFNFQKEAKTHLFEKHLS